jgi:hypothetical protein
VNNYLSRTMTRSTLELAPVLARRSNVATREARRTVTLLDAAHPGTSTETAENRQNLNLEVSHGV